MFHLTSATRRVAIAAAAAMLTVGVAGCGTAPDDGTPADTQSASVSLTDGWVKAVEVSSTSSPSMTMSPSASSSDGMDEMDMSGPMTAMFGTLHNPTDQEVTISGGSSPVAGKVELHEVVKTDSGAMQMQPKPGGFVIPAGGDYTLQPGGDHVMLMDLKESLDNGTEVTVTLDTSIGKVDFTVPVRTFSGADESYAATPSPSSS